MKTTANYGLKKPEGTDVVNIDDLNTNADTVDTQLKKINDNAGALSSLNTTAKTTLVAAINEVFQSGADVKSGTISAVNNKGASLSTSATWDDIVDAINAIARGQGNAVESQVLSGATFSNADGVKRTGAMPNKGAITITPSGSAQTIPLGYHNGQGKVSAVTVPVANVLSGTTIAGQAGTMPNKGAVTITPGTADQAIPAGYHNGSGKVKGEPNLTAENIPEGMSMFGIAGKLIGRSNLETLLINLKKYSDTLTLLFSSEHWFSDGDNFYVGKQYDLSGNLLQSTTTFTENIYYISKNYILTSSSSLLKLYDKSGNLLHTSSSRTFQISTAYIDEINDRIIVYNKGYGQFEIYDYTFNLLATSALSKADSILMPMGNSVFILNTSAKTVQINSANEITNINLNLMNQHSSVI